MYIFYAKVHILICIDSESPHFFCFINLRINKVGARVPIVCATCPNSYHLLTSFSSCISMNSPLAS